MHRIDNSSATLVKPAYEAAGPNPDGHFQAVLPGQGTIVSRAWAETVQEELAQLVENAGVALSKATDTQLVTVAGGAAAIKSHAADTGAVTNLHLRAVIASSTSQASGADSACVASVSCIASGTKAAAVGSSGCTVSAGIGAALGCEDCLIASTNTGALACVDVDVEGAQGSAISSFDSFVGNNNCLMASRNTECVDAYCVVGGYSAVAIVKTGANQNVAWKLDSTTGEVTATGGLRITDGTNEAAETYLWTGYAAILPANFGGCVIANTSVAAGSIVIWSFVTTEANLLQGRCTINGGVGITLYVYNVGGVNATNDIIFHYTVINPA